MCRLPWLATWEDTSEGKCVSIRRTYSRECAVCHDNGIGYSEERVYRLPWPVVQENIFATAGMGFMQAVAMYNASFVGFRRTVRPFPTAGVGVLVGGSMDD